MICGRGVFGLWCEMGPSHGMGCRTWRAVVEVNTGCVACADGGVVTGEYCEPFVYYGDVFLATHTSPMEPFFASIAADPVFLVRVERSTLVLWSTRRALLLRDGGCRSRVLCLRERRSIVKRGRAVRSLRVGRSLRCRTSRATASFGHGGKRKPSN